MKHFKPSIIVLALLFYCSLSSAQCTIGAFSATMINCNGAFDGSATANINSTAGPPYTYLWSNGGNTQTINNLGAGIYTVTITDNGGCSVVGDTTITEPPLLMLNGVETDISCNGLTDGSIDVTTSGGTTTGGGSGICDTLNVNPGIDPPYTGWVSNICNGEYGPTGPGEIGFWGKFSAQQYEIFQNNLVGTMPQGVTVDYNFNLKSYHFRGTGEMQVGFYAVDNSYYPFPVINGHCDDNCIGNSIVNSAGIYELTTVDVSATVSQGPFLNFTGSFNSTAPFPYDKIFITHSNSLGCTPNGRYIVFTDFLLTTCGATCEDYVYEWSNGETTEDISGLSDGTYNVTVTDCNGCDATESYTIAEPAELSIAFNTMNIGCGGAFGGIDATVTGGTQTGPLCNGNSYLWSNGATTEDLTNLPIGTYTVTVTDCNGCTAVMTDSITGGSSLILTGVETNISCNRLMDGSIDVTVSGGSTTGGGTGICDTLNVNPGIDPPYAGWVSNICAGEYGPTGPGEVGFWGKFSAQQYEIFQNDLVGTMPQGVTVDYNFNLKSYHFRGTGEMQVGFYAVDNSYYPFPTINGHCDDNCIGNSIVNSAGIYELTTVDVSATVSQGPFLNFTGSFNSTAPFPYDKIFITHSNSLGCTPNGRYIVFTDFLLTTCAYTCNDYAYEWSNGATTEDITGLSEGTYNVTVTDCEGCEATGSYTITEPDDISIIFSTVDVGCDSLDDGTATAVNVGGVSPISFQWDAGTGNQTNATASNLAAGTYMVTLTDSSGCTDRAGVTVKQLDCEPCPIDACVEAIINNTDICAAIATDPNDPLSTLDCDGDGVTNATECLDTTDPLDPCDYEDTSITLPVTADQTECPVPCPDLTPIMTILPGNIAGQSAVEVAVQITELDSVDTNGSIVTVRVPSDPRLVFVWNIGLTMAALVPVQNANWNYLGDNGFTHTWTYNGPGLVISAESVTAFGFQAIYDPQATDGQTTLTVTIIPFSGGECNPLNNTDSERLVYFE